MRGPRTPRGARPPAAAFLAVAVAPAAYAHAGLETTLAALLVAAAATVRAGGGLVPSSPGSRPRSARAHPPRPRSPLRARTRWPRGALARPVGRRIAAGTARSPSRPSRPARSSARGVRRSRAAVAAGEAERPRPRPGLRGRAARRRARAPGRAGAADRAHPGAGPGARALAAALGVHAVALVLAGGDAMPYARLGVPAAPLLALFVARLAVRTSPRAVAARAAIVLACGAARGAHGAGGAARARRSPRARGGGAPALASARGVAAVDVGWLRAVTAAPCATSPA